jgi:hypothetical protein
MPEKFDTLPADGGSYSRDKDGKYTRLDKPQKADPGKTARRNAAAKSSTPSDAKASNVRKMRADKE